MKPLLAYYGGKQRMVPLLLPLIPPHGVYYEVFSGGAALFWAKPLSRNSVLNDLNEELVNFYEVAKRKPYELADYVRGTLHSRAQFNRAKEIHLNQSEYSDIERAWATWVGCNQSFGAKYFDPWGYQKNEGCVMVAGKRDTFIQNIDEIARRLERTQIECIDAVKLLSRTGVKNAFFYVDPPYIDSDQGHYAGYTAGDFRNLLEVLQKLGNPFMLSCYDGELVNQYVEANGWEKRVFDKPLALNKVTSGKSRKTEVVIMNYNIEKFGLFS